MRILHVNDYEQGGGAEVVVATTIRLLREHGCEVDLFTSDGRRTLVSYIDSSANRAALHQRLTAFKPQIVHLHNFYHALSPGILATLAAWKRESGGRVVMTAHDANLICPNPALNHFTGGSRQAVDASRLCSLSYLFSRRWDNRSLAYAWLKLAQHVWNYRVRDRRRVLDCVFCPSEFLCSVLRDAGLPATFLPNPAPNVLKQLIDLPGRSQRRQRFIFAGRVEPEKGLAEFLHLLPADFSGELIVVGEGSELERVRRVSDDRGLSDVVRCVGRRSHEETIREIAASHVLVLPTLCFENCPMALLEALACSTNVLATDQPATREIVEQCGVGYLFKANDRESLAAALKQIQHAIENGTINRFDCAAFLESRSEAAYITRVMQHYEAQHQSVPKT